MIAYHIRNSGRLSGREGQRSFWLWFALVAGLCVALGVAVVGSLIQAAFAHMARFARDHPESATVSRGPGRVEIQIYGPHPEFLPNMNAIMAFGAVVSLIAIVLLGAAMVRRLHDGNGNGTWVLRPVPFWGVGGGGLSCDLCNARRGDAGRRHLCADVARQHGRAGNAADLPRAARNG